MDNLQNKIIYVYPGRNSFFTISVDNRILGSCNNMVVYNTDENLKEKKEKKHSDNLRPRYIRIPPTRVSLSNVRVVC